DGGTLEAKVTMSIEAAVHPIDGFVLSRGTDFEEAIANEDLGSRARRRVHIARCTPGDATLAKGFGHGPWRQNSRMDKTEMVELALVVIAREITVMGAAVSRLVVWSLAAHVVKLKFPRVGKIGLLLDEEIGWFTDEVSKKLIEAFGLAVVAR